MNCGTVVKWYIDKDGDKWYDKDVAPIESQYNPGGFFIRDPLGPDCNDNVFSADNSVCSVTPPPCTNKMICDKGYNMVNCECVKDDPCITMKAKADALTKLANTLSVKTNIKQLNDDAKTKKDETSFDVKKDSTGVFIAGTIIGGAGNTSKLIIGSTTSATAHAHPDNALMSVYPAHSAGDIYGLNIGYTAFNNYDTSITVGITDTYALIVEDASAFTNYVNNYTKTACIEADGFKPGTDVDKDFWDAYDILKGQGETADEAYASALAYFLSSYNTGVGLYHSKVGTDGTTTFKRKETTKVVTPAVPASGNTPAEPEKTTFTKKDC